MNVWVKYLWSSFITGAVWSLWGLPGPSSLLSAALKPSLHTCPLPQGACHERARHVGWWAAWSRESYDSRERNSYGTFRSLRKWHFTWNFSSLAHRLAWAWRTACAVWGRSIRPTWLTTLWSLIGCSWAGRVCFCGCRSSGRSQSLMFCCQNIVTVWTYL